LLDLQFSPIGITAGVLDVLISVLVPRELLPAVFAKSPAVDHGNVRALVRGSAVAEYTLKEWVYGVQDHAGIELLSELGVKAAAEQALEVALDDE